VSDRELKTFQAYIFNVVQVSVYLLHSIRFRFFDISRANVNDMLPSIATDEADFVVKLVESIRTHADLTRTPISIFTTTGSQKILIEDKIAERYVINKNKINII
jgi:hypothetical protein